MFDLKHTAENVLELMEGTGGMIEKAKLTHTMRTYTTDNCATMEKAFKNKPLVGFFANLLNLVVKAALKAVRQVRKLVSKLHKVTTYFNHCPGALLLLKDNEEWLGFPTLTVLTEVPTRWNSFLKSGRRILEIQKPLFVTLHEKTDIKITIDDFSLLQEVCNELEVFEEATIKVQSDTDFTLNSVMPILNNIKDKLDPKKNVHCQNKSVIRKFRAELLKNLEKRYKNKNTRTLLMTATALDPSFFRMKKYRINEYMQSLKETMLKIAKKMDNSREESQSSIKEASTPASTNKNSTSKASTTLNLYSSDSEDDESSQTNSNTIVSNVEEELKDYKAYVMNQNEYIKYKIDKGDWSLSAFWKAHESRFKYLSETVKAITFLKDNYKYFPKDATETDSQATSDDDPENDSEADSEED